MKANMKNNIYIYIYIYTLSIFLFPRYFQRINHGLKSFESYD